MATLTTPVLTEHSWELRYEDFEDGQVVRRYECVHCAAVRFE